MKLRNARIEGFQSFGDSGQINFKDGINLVIGQNNAGKSALLRALLPSLPDDRHRTSLKWETFRLPQPKVTLSIQAGSNEIHDWVLQTNGHHYFPIAPNLRLPPSKLIDKLVNEPGFHVVVTRTPGSQFSSEYPTHRLFEPSSHERHFIAMRPQNGEIHYDRGTGNSDTLATLFWHAWQREMFYFAPERLTIGEASPGYGARLQPNASNLPNVLHTLNNERGDTFRRLVHHLNAIFPTVGNLSVRTKKDNTNLEIRVWPTEAMERVELSFPLSSSGTGVSQVIALLAAIMTVDQAVIIIDEINSFLHPAAVKALLRIVQTQYTQHQYIISTHAPEVIGFSNPSSVHLIRRHGYESTVEQLSLSELSKLREVAEHLGVSMSDVFAAERVVWVEGPTEELCFPYLYQQLVGPLPRGMLITSVAATGDFNTNKRDPAIVYEVYRRLSAAAASLTVSVAFSFDTERLSDAEKREMTQQSGGLLHFLPRRHFECYLLSPAAISAFIASKDLSSSESVTPVAVAEAITKTAGTQEFKTSQWNGDIADTVWLAQVDAAKLISQICGSLTEHRVTFSKKADSLSLLRYMIEHERERLASLLGYVRSLVEGSAYKS